MNSSSCLVFAHIILSLTSRETTVFSFSIVAKMLSAFLLSVTISIYVALMSRRRSEVMLPIRSLLYRQMKGIVFPLLNKSTIFLEVLQSMFSLSLSSSDILQGLFVPSILLCWGFLFSLFSVFSRNWCLRDACSLGSSWTSLLILRFATLFLLDFDLELEDVQFPILSLSGSYEHWGITDIYFISVKVSKKFKTTVDMSAEWKNKPFTPAHLIGCDGTKWKDTKDTSFKFGHTNPS